MPDQPFVKVFAAPGIDSHPSEQGLYNSGAGLHPNTQTLKTKPYDWINESSEQGYGSGVLVANGDTGNKTKSKQANHLSVRRRGIAPWGGFFKGGRSHSAMQHRGGIVDSNTGASALIAGGPGQASTLVRVQGGRTDRAMKLPVLPVETKRGGLAPMPQGGGSHEPLTAPLKSNVPGFPSIFMFRNQAKAAK